MSMLTGKEGGKKDRSEKTRHCSKKEKEDES